MHRVAQGLVARRTLCAGAVQQWRGCRNAVPLPDTPGDTDASRKARAASSKVRRGWRVFPVLLDEVRRLPSSAAVGDALAEWGRECDSCLQQLQDALDSQRGDNPHTEPDDVREARDLTFLALCQKHAALQQSYDTLLEQAQHHDDLQAHIQAAYTQLRTAEREIVRAVEARRQLQQDYEVADARASSLKHHRADSIALQQRLGEAVQALQQHRRSSEEREHRLEMQHRAEVEGLQQRWHSWCERMEGQLGQVGRAVQEHRDSLHQQEQSECSLQTYTQLHAQQKAAEKHGRAAADALRAVAGEAERERDRHASEHRELTLALESTEAERSRLVQRLGDAEGVLEAHRAECANLQQRVGEVECLEKTQRSGREEAERRLVEAEKVISSQRAEVAALQQQVVAQQQQQQGGGGVPAEEHSRLHEESRLLQASVRSSWAQIKRQRASIAELRQQRDEAASRAAGLQHMQEAHDALRSERNALVADNKRYRASLCTLAPLSFEVIDIASYHRSQGAVRLMAWAEVQPYLEHLRRVQEFKTIQLLDCLVRPDGNLASECEDVLFPRCAIVTTNGNHIGSLWSKLAHSCRNESAFYIAAGKR